jgi:hypothetical protein
MATDKNNISIHQSITLSLSLPRSLYDYLSCLYKYSGRSNRFSSPHCPHTRIHSMPWNCANFIVNFIEFGVKKLCSSPLKWNVGITDRSNSANDRTKIPLV